MTPKDAINWAPGPPNKRGKYVPIYKAQPGVYLTFIICCPHLEGAYLHWDGRRSRPCTRRMPDDPCHYCDNFVTRRWYGYLGVWETRHDRVGLLEFTADAARECDLGDVLMKGDLRGLRVTVSRATTSVTARVILRLENGDAPAEGMPAAFDIREALVNCWNAT